MKRKAEDRNSQNMMRSPIFIAKNIWGGKKHNLRHWYPKHGQCQCLQRWLETQEVRDLDKELVFNILFAVGPFCDERCENRKEQFECDKKICS